MNEIEEWREIPSLPEYLASSLGRLQRVPHERPMPRGGTRRYGGKPWVGVWDAAQSRYVIQYQRKTYRVAKLICEAFNGPSPFSGANTLHIDEDSRNNRPSNLKWGTQKENLNAPGFLIYCRSRRGAANPGVKGRRLKKGGRQ